MRLLFRNILNCPCVRGLRRFNVSSYVRWEEQSVREHQTWVYWKRERIDATRLSIYYRFGTSTVILNGQRFCAVIHRIGPSNACSYCVIELRYIWGYERVPLTAPDQQKLLRHYKSHKWMNANLSLLIKFIPPLKDTRLAVPCYEWLGTFRSSYIIFGVSVVVVDTIALTDKNLTLFCFHCSIHALGMRYEATVCGFYFSGGHNSSTQCVIKTVIYALCQDKRRHFFFVVISFVTMENPLPHNSFGISRYSDFDRKFMGHAVDIRLLELVVQECHATNNNAGPGIFGIGCRVWA